MVYTGTSVTYGRERLLLRATGMSTAFGKLAGLLGEIEREKPPFKRNLTSLGAGSGLQPL